MCWAEAAPKIRKLRSAGIPWSFPIFDGVPAHIGIFSKFVNDKFDLPFSIPMKPKFPSKDGLGRRSIKDLETQALLGLENGLAFAPCCSKVAFRVRSNRDKKHMEQQKYPSPLADRSLHFPPAFMPVHNGAMLFE